MNFLDTCDANVFPFLREVSNTASDGLEDPNKAAEGLTSIVGDDVNLITIKRSIFSPPGNEFLVFYDENVLDSEADALKGSLFLIVDGKNILLAL